MSALAFRLLLLATSLLSCTRETQKKEKPATYATAKSTAVPPSVPATRAMAQAHKPTPRPVAKPIGPRSASPLAVEGFRAASHVAPWPQKSWPRPVVVVLHGNFDRPEWECETWHKVLGQRAWVLCPRGSPNPWASKEENRWTYTTFKKVRAEIVSGLAALSRKYPGRVDTRRMVLAGFSLGAMLAPALFVQLRGRFESLFIVEGGLEKMTRRRFIELKRAGLRHFAMAMGTHANHKVATSMMPFFRQSKVPCSYIHMKNAGHNYGPDFFTHAPPILAQMLPSSP